MQKTFLKTARFSLILVYLVIIAGSVVRMTGSGMGCPDWPRCFGYFIPPTSIEKLQWQPNKTFKKGQVIIRNEALFTAKSNFTTKEALEPNNWQLYDKHDYAEFNVWHTWIEYINRMVTVVLSLPMLLLLVLSILNFKNDKVLTALTGLTIFILGIQAVLGKIVVDTNLKTGMITIHMVVAFLLLALLLLLIYRTTADKKQYTIDATTKTLIILTTIITLFQVILGTQVREFIDLQIEELGYNTKSLWLSDPPIKFYVHRSFSIAIVLLNLYVVRRILKQYPRYTRPKWSLIFILLSVITGIAMYYFDFPFSSQPLHLVIAALLFGVQFYMVLETRKGHKSL